MTRTALVTGAGSGLGRAVALALADEGHQLALLDIDGVRVDAVAAETLARGAPRVMAFAADVASEPDMARCVGRSAAELGPPVAAFANAGIEINGPAHLLAFSTWQRVIDVNLTGIFLTVKHVLAALVEGGVGGSIVCTGSPAALVGFAGGGNGAYGASKGGVVALVKSLAVDYASLGIRVNAVIPGAIDTPSPRHRRPHRTSGHPAGRPPPTRRHPDPAGSAGPTRRGSRCRHVAAVESLVLRHRVVSGLRRRGDGSERQRLLTNNF